MAMKVTFLGTGTSQGVPLIACECAVCTSTDARDKRLRSSILIQDNDTHIVIDTGPDFRQQMLRTQIKHLDAIVFTHAHKDHVAGMDDVRGFNFKMKKAVPVFCTPQVEQQLQREFAYIFDEHKYPGIPDIDIHRIHRDISFTVHHTLLQPIEVMHYKLPVLGFRVHDFVYITDANFIATTELAKAKGCDTLVLNALRKEKHVCHFTLEEALHIIDEVKPRVAYLTHISHQLGMHAEVEKELPPHVHLAHDGLVLQFT
jgi:phosphoribosyl 1,2-cyclic phosphate phosphodiesterase